MWGVNIGYWAYKEDKSKPTPEDVDYIIDKLSDAIHDRGMTFGGGSAIENDEEMDNDH